MTQRMRTHTEYDFAHVEELQRVVSKAITAQATRRTRISNFAWGAVITFAALLIMTQKSPIIGGILLVFGLFFMTKGIFHYKFVTFGVRQTMDKEIPGSDYILEKNYLLVVNPKASNQYPYADCYRLLETEGCIYYITKNGQGLVLDKSNLKGGSVEELRAWMESKCGKKLEWMGKSPKEA